METILVVVTLTTPAGEDHLDAPQSPSATGR
jgi:hypothetical protein